MKKQTLIVTVPAANLRKEPISPSPGYTRDDLQETQLLCNEILLCDEERGDWYHVEAIEQKKATRQGDWCGYPGWVKKTAVMVLDTLPTFNGVVKKLQGLIMTGPDVTAECVLLVPIGTRLTIDDAGNDNYYKTIFSDGHEGWVSKTDVKSIEPAADIQQLRQDIVETTKLFLDMPYLWGGRSAYTPIVGQSEEGRGQCPGVHQPRTPNPETGTDLSVVIGVDCSGLTNLVYRVHNLDIPRDACDQWRASTQLDCSTLEPGDLIFISAEGAYDIMSHVMLYIGGEEFIEASETGSVVIVNSFEKRFGTGLHNIVKEGAAIGKKKIFYASMLKTRDNA